MAERSVYVKRFPRDWTAREVTDFFEKEVGDVDHVNMKGHYCFVVFKQDSADRAVKLLHGFETERGLKLIVERSSGDNVEQKPQEPSDTLFVVNFDKDRTTQADVEDFFRGYDLEKVEMWRGGMGIRAKNFCFVQMRSVAEAERALRDLNKRYLGDNQVTLEFKTGKPGTAPHRARNDPPRGPRDGRRRDDDDRRPRRYEDDYDRRPRRYEDDYDRRPRRYEDDDDRRLPRVPRDDRRPRRYEDDDDRRPPRGPRDDDRRPRRYEDDDDRRPPRRADDLDSRAPPPRDDRRARRASFHDDDIDRRDRSSRRGESSDRRPRRYD